LVSILNISISTVQQLPSANHTGGEKEMSRKTYSKPEVKEIRSSSLAWEQCGTSDPWDCLDAFFCCPTAERQLDGTEGFPWNAYKCCG